MIPKLILLFIYDILLLAIKWLFRLATFSERLNLNF